MLAGSAQTGDRDVGATGYGFEVGTGAGVAEWERAERMMASIVDRNLDGQRNLVPRTSTAKTVLPIRHLAASPDTNHVAGRPQDTGTQYPYWPLEIPTGSDQPTNGLYSDTAPSKYAGDKAPFDVANDLVQGRRQPSELQNLIFTEKSAVGDAMRRKCEEQLQTGGATAA